MPAKAKKPATKARKPRSDRRVVTAVRAELRDLAKRDPVLAASSLAATALALARELDNREHSLTSRTNSARAMLDIFNRLRELAPEAEEKTALDELAERRAERLAGGR